MEAKTFNLKTQCKEAPSMRGCHLAAYSRARNFLNSGKTAKIPRYVTSTAN